MLELKIDGRVGSMNERKTGTGKRVLNFSVVSDRIVRNGDKKEVVDDWISCTKWLRDDETVSLKIGDDISFWAFPSAEAYKDRNNEIKAKLCATFTRYAN